MSDTIIVMDKGRIQQIGTPEDIYNEPKNAFVADFIGESNIIEGTMIRDLLVEFADTKFVCVDKGFGENTLVDIVIRPEDIKVVPEEEGMLTGMVTSVTFKGVHYEMLVKEREREWMIHSTVMEPVGSQIGMVFEPESIHIMKKVIQE